MNGKKAVKKYVRGSKALLVICAILVALGLFLVIKGAVDRSVDARMFGVIFLVFGGLLAMLKIEPAIREFKCLSALESRNEMDRAAAELAGEDIMVVGKDKARLTENYLFSKGMGVALRLDEIVWCYVRVVKTNHIPVNSTLVVCTKNMKDMVGINLGHLDKEGELEAPVAYMQRKNPKLLVGFSKENRKAYRELRKQG